MARGRLNEGTPALVRGPFVAEASRHMSLPFGPLPPYKPRTFLPPDLNLGDWNSIAPWFDALESRAPACDDLPAFETWLRDWGELGAALDEERSKRYIAMSCHTDDKEAEAAYLAFVEQVDPEVKPKQFRLCRIFLAHPIRALLPPARYSVFDRDTALAVEVFRQENVPLEVEEARLGNEYQKLSGGLTVNFRGAERTLPQMAVHMEDPDRATREEAWRLTSTRRLASAAEFDDIFGKLEGLRVRMAANAGHANYRDFAFRLRGRFDYSPDDCTQFHDAIEAEFMPLVRELHEARRRRLGVDVLRPWDTSVDPSGRPPLRPFAETSALEEGGQRIFDRIDPTLAEGFRDMRRRRLLDLANRKGKAPGGYQSTLSEARAPFIFMNAVGLQRDVETLLHEAGHAFHAQATVDEPLYAYRSAPIEFCEVASMAMELIAAPCLDEFYSPQDAARARRVHLEGIVGVFPWIATVDAFQHWLYTHPGGSAEGRAAAWTNLMKRFGGAVDWTGLEEARARLWHKQLHIFLYPFYYVEYGIAQLGALQIWARSLEDPKAALEGYKAGLALGGSRPLPELFEAAGCRFDFSRDALRPLAARLRNALEELAEA
jgi:oligoendopeptidase F